MNERLDRPGTGWTGYIGNAPRYPITVTKGKSTHLFVCLPDSVVIALITDYIKKT